VKKLFNVQELLLCKAKRHETKLMHPSSSRAFFQKRPHTQFLKKFQLPFNLIFSEKIIQGSRTFAMQVQMA